MDSPQRKKLRKISAELHYKFSKLFDEYDLTDEEFRYLQLEVAKQIIIDETNWQKEEILENLLTD